MTHWNFTIEEISEILAEPAQGQVVKEFLNKHDITREDYQRWQADYELLCGANIKRLRELEVENKRLVRLLEQFEGREEAIF